MSHIERRPSWPDPWRCTVELLVVPGCPGTELAIARIREATELLGIETNLRLLTIDGEAQARTHEFVGSPTVRVEGVDVEETARDRPVAVTCRLYRDGDVIERAPPLTWIRAALARSVPIVRARAGLRS